MFFKVSFRRSQYAVMFRSDAMCDPGVMRMALWGNNGQLRIGRYRFKPSGTFFRGTIFSGNYFFGNPVVALFDGEPGLSFGLCFCYFQTGKNSSQYAHNADSKRLSDRHVS
jgi:hypothetical protein